MAPKVLPNNATQRHVIHAGELVMGKGDREIHTLLGSCVSVTLFHPIKKIAGICHFALPGIVKTNNRGKPDPRYAIDCFSLFEKHAKDYQCQLSEFRANIVGGGNMLDDPALDNDILRQTTDKAKVGERNALIALKLAHQYKLDIQSVDVGEFGYRKLRFFTGTGKLDIEYSNTSK